MGKASKITLIVIVGLIGLLYGAYLFLVPSLLDFNNYKPEIREAVKDETGLEIEFDEIKLHTYFNFTAGVTAKNVVLTTSENEILLAVDKAKVKVQVLPLIFGEVVVDQVELGGPEDSTTKIRSEKHDFKTEVIADLRLKNKGKLPEIDGFLKFDKLSLVIDGQKLPDSHGNFNFSGKKADIDSKLFITADSFLELSGKVKNIEKQDFDLNVKSSEIRLEDVVKFANTFAEMFNADTNELNNLDIKGKLKADFNLKNNDFSGYLNILETRVSHSGLSQPLQNINSTLNFDKNKVVFKNTSGFLGNIKFNVTGDITSDLISDIKIDLPAVNMGSVSNLVDNSKLLVDVKKELTDFRNISGNLKTEVFIKGDLNKEIDPDIYLTPDKIAVYYVPAKLPVSIVSGNIHVAGNKAQLKDISTVISKSPMNLYGEIVDLDSDVNLDVKANGQITSADIRQHADKGVQDALKSVNKIPFNAFIAGNPENLSITAQTNFDNFANVIKLDQPANITNILSFNARITPKSINLTDSGLFAGSNISKNSAGIYKLDSASKLVSLEGIIDQYDTKTPVLNNIKTDISGLNMRLKDPSGKIQINGDLLVNGKAGQPITTGTLKIKNADFPSLMFKADNIDVSLKSSAEQKKLKDGSVIICEGKVTSDELVASNLLNKNLSFNFGLSSSNNLMIRDFITHTSGGTATGVMDMNLETTKLRVDLTSDNIEINALATNFAQTPDEIFGGMNGRIQLTTMGKTPEEMTSNAVGRTDFQIKNGYLPKIGSIHYLFNAAGLSSRGGVNAKDETTHFESLDGLVMINKGILDIQEILVRGQFLSSFISGSLNMANNHANLTILSKLSGKMVRQLGPIADFSVDKLAEQLPGQWGEIGRALAQQRAVKQYSGSERIPSLIAEPLENDRDFAVKIRGNINEPSSVRILDWLPR